MPRHALPIDRPFRSIDDVVQAYVSLEEMFVARGDRRALFLSASVPMTVEMHRRIGAGTFEDSDWMARYLVAFAELYRQALHGYEKGNGAAIPACWRIAFDSARGPDTLLLQDLLLGINAHINHDLALALTEAGLDPDTDRRRRDHDSVNEVLRATIDPVQQRLADIYSPALGLLDMAAGVLDEALTQFSFVRARDAAWDSAISLGAEADRARRTDMQRRLDDEAAGLANTVLQLNRFLPHVFAALREIESAAGPSLAGRRRMMAQLADRLPPARSAPRRRATVEVTQRPHVIVVGGGLAGMTAALALAKHKVRVTLVEKEKLLGGKAGARKENGFWEDHGYHIFPAWYANVRQLMRDLGCANNLVDFDRFYFLRRGDFPNLRTVRDWASAINVFQNFGLGLLPWDDTILSYYFFADLAAEPFSERAFLDRVSANGLLRSRFYANESVAAQQHQNTLQASSIPYYELSAMTLHKLIQATASNQTPFLSVLNGNLYEKFIEPFARQIGARGVEILMERTVERLECSSARVSGVRLTDGKRLDADAVVIATPIEQTLGFVDDRLYAAEQQHYDPRGDQRGLADLAFLRSASMAALHLHFRRRIPGIPREHVLFYESRFGLSFIDVSQLWEGLAGTTLNLIASNFEPLREVSQADAARHILDELREYVPAIRQADIETATCVLQPHIDQPLFLNTTGAWHFRPKSREGTGIANLFVAGDYCRSDADLTCMESAVESGIQAARSVLDRCGVPTSLEPAPIHRWPREVFAAVKYAALPLIASLSVWQRARDMVFGSRPRES